MGWFPNSGVEILMRLLGSGKPTSTMVLYSYNNCYHNSVSTSYSKSIISEVIILRKHWHCPQKLLNIRIFRNWIGMYCVLLFLLCSPKLPAKRHFWRSKLSTELKDYLKNSIPTYFNKYQIRSCPSTVKFLSSAPRYC